MMAGAGGAMRATGWRATAIRFQQFGAGGASRARVGERNGERVMAGAGGAIRRRAGDDGPKAPRRDQHDTRRHPATSVSFWDGDR